MKTRAGGVVVVGVFIALSALVFLRTSGVADATSEASDQRISHWPTIRAFAAEWPAVTLSSSRVAMIPGYHYAMAGLYRLTASPRVVRAANLLCGVLLVLLVVSTSVTYAGPLLGAAVSVPLACSSYVVGPAVWLATDNAGWLVAGLVLVDALRRGQSKRRLLTSGVAATVAVLIRQIHVWTVVPMLSRAATFWRRDGSTALTAAAWLACASPLVAIAFFVLAWHGLVPPAFRQAHGGGPNLATPPVALALAGIFGIFYIGSTNTGSTSIGPRGWMLIGTAAVMPVAVATDYAPDAGRWGGAVWSLVRATPHPFGRSLVLMPLAAVGAAVIVLLYERSRVAGRSTEARVLLVSLAAWIAVQTANSQAWQRYLEPGILIGLAWLTALSTVRRSDQRTPVLEAVGPIVLGGLLAGAEVLMTFSRPGQ